MRLVGKISPPPSNHQTVPLAAASCYTNYIIPAHTICCYVCKIMSSANFNESSQLTYKYTGCIKMVGAVWKLIIFTSMVNRFRNTSSNKIIIVQVYDTCLQMFDVCTLGHTAHIKAIVQFLPYSDQHAAILRFFLYKGTLLPETADTSI
jgi:hypothetical protein